MDQYGAVAAVAEAIEEAANTNSGLNQGAKEKKAMNSKERKAAAKAAKAAIATQEAPKSEPVIPAAVAPQPVKPRPTPRVGNVIKEQFRSQFAVVPGLKTATGSAVVAQANDVVTHKLSGLTSDGLQAVAAELGITWKWGHLNPGMQRMNLGNVIRGLVRSGKLTI